MYSCGLFPCHQAWKMQCCSQWTAMVWQIIRIWHADPCSPLASRSSAALAFPRRSAGLAHQAEQVPFYSIWSHPCCPLENGNYLCPKVAPLPWAHIQSALPQPRKWKSCCAYAVHMKTDKQLCCGVRRDRVIRYKSFAILCIRCFIEEANIVGTSYRQCNAMPIWIHLKFLSSNACNPF